MAKKTKNNTITFDQYLDEIWGDKGEKGYIDSKSANGKPSENRELVDDLNRKIGITKAQAEAMKAGSMFGWKVPAADPKNYDENGKPVKPKRNKDYER